MQKTETHGSINTAFIDEKNGNLIVCIMAAQVNPATIMRRPQAYCLGIVKKLFRSPNSRTGNMLIPSKNIPLAAQKVTSLVGRNLVS